MRVNSVGVCRNYISQKPEVVYLEPMKKYALFFFTFLFSINGVAQPFWTWEELAPMPVSISNNAVTEVISGGEVYVCTFGGIDSTKTLQGISGTSMRMPMSTGVWEYIPDLPDTLGKIAAAASAVNGIVYVIGGYHVFAGPPYELSSDRVHRYDPATNAYLSDGTPVPVPIDDQVQAVWRDSLIYVVTGWSQTLNVPDVQIYNPALDQWSVGTSTPNNANYKAFGASGVILGDTIFYYGGAAGSSFNASGRLRKGVINPDNPTEITWSELGNVADFKGYRMAAAVIDDKAWWIGGSDITYNYDGIAYNGSGGVPALERIMGLSQSEPTTNWIINEFQPYGVMDLRGAAKISDNSVVICGGMMGAQEVTNRVFRLNYQGPDAIGEYAGHEVELVSNILLQGDVLQLKESFGQSVAYEIFDQRGMLLAQGYLRTSETWISESAKLKSGSYILRLDYKRSALFVIQ